MFKHNVQIQSGTLPIFG